VITDAFSDTVARLDAPLVVVTAASQDRRGGCVVGFHTQCSIDPVRYAIWLSKANFTYRVALFAENVAIHFLDAADHDLAELFGGTTGDEMDKFEHCDWTAGPSGVPLLDRCANRLVLRRHTMWDDGSDHVCLVGEVIDVSSGSELQPLRLSAAHDITAGHPAEERGTPEQLTAAEGDGSPPRAKEHRWPLDRNIRGANLPKRRNATFGRTIRSRTWRAQRFGSSKTKRPAPGTRWISPRPTTPDTSPSGRVVPGSLRRIRRGPAR